MIRLLVIRILIRAVQMSAKRLYLVALLLVIGCHQAGVGQDAPMPGPPAERMVETSQLDEQLKLTRDVLLNKDSSEPMRINAARVMLSSENPSARKILLDTLRQSQNSAARMAVCKALIKTRGNGKVITGKSDFIEPLLEILTTEQDFALTKLAAQATLMFGYEQIQKRLEKAVTDPALSVGARLNVVCALGLHPDVKAAMKLVSLVDSEEKEVAAAASEELRSLDIPTGTDARSRRLIMAELRAQGQEAFLRDRLLRGAAQIRNLQNQSNLWQKQYLAALDKIYEAYGQGEDVAKGKFLAEHLSGSEATVRLWALDKVERWWQGTGDKSTLLTELGPVLVGLISDQSSDVRLKTAKLLSSMVEVNSAEKLLDRHRVEKDDQVRTELFIALGRTCGYAFLPESSVKLSEDIKKQTLELAVEYLSQQEPTKARRGAEVIRKLLEHNGLSPVEVGHYLNRLQERYKQAQAGADGALRGELLGAMAGLCAESVYKADAKRLFRSLFVQALQDETNQVRETAVDGLLQIDKAQTFRMLRKNFLNNQSPIVRKQLIDLAGEIGGADDLVWLAKKVGSPVEGDLAWQAMLKIFQGPGSNGALLARWIGEFDSPNAVSELSDEQRLSLLDIAESKATAENNRKMLKNTWERLAELYKKGGKFKQAAEYFGRLHEAAATDKQKKDILPDLLYAYLRLPNVEAAAQLVNNSLLESDLDPNSHVVVSIDAYLNAPPVGTAGKDVLVELLAKIEAGKDRPEWDKQVKRWGELLKAKEVGKPDGKEPGAANKSDWAEQLLLFAMGSID